MALFTKLLRSVSRSNITMILVSITLFMTFVSFHLYQKDKIRPELLPVVQAGVIEKTLTDETRDTKGII